MKNLKNKLYIILHENIYWEIDKFIYYKIYNKVYIKTQMPIEEHIKIPVFITVHEEIDEES